jgi:hypothetical protein
MPYYQDSNNQLHFLSATDIANGGLALLPQGCTAISDAQALANLTALAAAVPNGENFIQSVKTAVGGILAANALMTVYPAFFPAIQQQQWQDVQALIIDAHSKNVINDGQYAAIKAQAATNNIPVTL